MMEYCLCSKLLLNCGHWGAKEIFEEWELYGQLSMTVIFWVYMKVWTIYLQEINLEKEDVLGDSCSSDKKMR